MSADIMAERSENVIGELPALDWHMRLRDIEARVHFLRYMLASGKDKLCFLLDEIETDLGDTGRDILKWSIPFT